MMCPKCDLEMYNQKVVNDEIHFVCKKCGKEIVKSIEELEKTTHED